MPADFIFGSREHGPALWKRVLFAAGVLGAAMLMAWAVSGAVDHSNATAVQALKQSEVRNEQQAAKAAQAAQLAFEASARAVQAQQLGQAIQASRKRDCRAANARHARTVSVFDRLLRQAARGARGARRRELQQSRRATLKLIDAIVPVYNCANP